MVTQAWKPDCPYCCAPMRPAVMACDQCNVEVRARFQAPKFDHLSNDDLEFLEKYLLAGFSIKTLARESGLGYVAIRNRLDRILESYRILHTNEAAKHAILDKLEQGEITAEAAAEAIERL